MKGHRVKYIAGRLHHAFACLGMLAVVAAPSASAFESGTSDSIIRFGPFGGISFEIQGNLTSSSFSDLFAQVASSGTASKLRFLEAQKPVDESSVRSYVDKEYPGLPAAEKARLADVLIEGKRADEHIKARMNSATLSDDQKIIFGQERERLLNKTWAYESKVRDSYYKHSKPSSYSDTVVQLRKLSNDVDVVNICTLDESGCPASAKSLSLDALEEQKKALVNQLISAPYEVNQLNNASIRGFQGEIKNEIKSLTQYIQDLYSKKVR